MIFLNFLIFSLLVFLSPVAVAEAKKCNGAKDRNVSILLDLSTQLDQPTDIALNTLISRVINDLPSNGQLNIYSIKPKAADVKDPDFFICIPNFDAMKGVRFKDRAVENFQSEVLKNFNTIKLTNANAQQSPIIENIYKITHANFLANRTSNPDGNVLIVISDFIQFSQLANFYNSVPSYVGFSNQSLASSWLPKSTHVKLHMILLNTPDSSKVNLRNVRDFWLDYSKENFKKCSFSGLNDASIGFKNDC